MSSRIYNHYEIDARLSNLLEKFLEQEFDETDYSCHEDYSSLSDNSSNCNYNSHFSINEYSPSSDIDLCNIFYEDSNVESEDLDSDYKYASTVKENSEESDYNYDSSTERDEDEESNKCSSREKDVPEDLRDLLRFYNDLDDGDDVEVDRQFEDIENDNESECIFMLNCDIHPLTSDKEDNILRNDIKKCKTGAIRNKKYRVHQYLKPWTTSYC
ncbi:unnamed protein product [Rhizophagus irregularis]|nr:unnamed protein product [Rhizophagus irregularis]CAB5366842.1 unnamed protein product [Rhizophagus irregularis]